MSQTHLQIAQLVANTAAEGPGRRMAIWFQGCPLRCPGCCNPEMLSFEGGVSMTVAEIMAKVDSSIEGITLLGGEPFAHAAGAADLAEASKQHKLSVMIFSGFTLEELREKRDAQVDRLLSLTDILVDGPYLRDQPETQRRWIGSRNQRIHFLSSGYSPDDECWRQPNTLELRLEANVLSVNGFPSSATKEFWRRPNPARKELSSLAPANPKISVALYGSTIAERRRAISECQQESCSESDIILIREASRSPQFETRRRAAELMAMLESTSSLVDLLETAAKDPMWTVRETLFVAFAASMPNRTRFSELILELAEGRLLADGNELVRASTLRIIQLWPEIEKRQQILARLLQVALTGSVTQRLRAIRSTCDMVAADPQRNNTPYARQLTELLKICAQDSHRKIRRAAVLGLMHFTDEPLDAVPWLLVRRFDAEPGVAAAANESLAALMSRIKTEAVAQQADLPRGYLQILLALVNESSLATTPEEQLLETARQVTGPDHTDIESQLLATVARRQRWLANSLGLNPPDVTPMPATDALAKHLEFANEGTSSHRKREAIWFLGKLLQILVDRVKPRC
ncbi:MAG: 4Fe-4S cluster-binding domain-containing protein [Pirellulaceae bacterium]|nr:4Fe-4S cluster-binding domain-containing protein [Pirellulaceae bacterium]